MLGSDVANVLGQGKRKKCPLRVELNHRKTSPEKTATNIKERRFQFRFIRIFSSKQSIILRKHVVLARLDGKINNKIKENK